MAQRTSQPCLLSKGVEKDQDFHALKKDQDISDPLTCPDPFQWLGPLAHQGQLDRVVSGAPSPSDTAPELDSRVQTVCQLCPALHLSSAPPELRQTEAGISRPFSSFRPPYPTHGPLTETEGSCPPSSHREAAAAPPPQILRFSPDVGLWVL